MSLFRHPKSAYWWVRFTLGGREVRQSSGTRDRKAAEEFEHQLRHRYWRQVRLGETHHTWEEAKDRWLKERGGKRSIERDVRIFKEYREIFPLSLRDTTTTILAELKDARLNVVSQATLNRELSLLRAVMNAAVGWEWIETVPRFPIHQLELSDPRWLTRAEFQKLLTHLPKHTAELARFAVATGIRRSNITGLTWDRVNMDERFAHIPGSQAKAKRGIPVPLNDDALAVLERQKGGHEKYVFVYRGAPVYQVATKAWRAGVKAAGFEGLRFHDLRHTWASWQAQAGTPAYVLRELGGWASDAMVKRYSHLGAGDLAQFANRTLVSGAHGQAKTRPRKKT